MRKYAAFATAALIAGAALSLAWLRPGILQPGAPATATPIPVQGRIAPQAAAMGRAGADPLTFRHVNITTSSDAPELCLLFSAPLIGRPDAPHDDAPAGAAHSEEALAKGARYGDWVTVAPQASVAMNVRGSSLCVGGLAYGTDYKLTLHHGLPAANGARLAADEVVPVTLGDRDQLVDIGGDGFILPRAVAHGLTIQTVNVRRLRIHVLRVSDRLVPAETRSRQRSDVDLKATGLWGYALRNLLVDTASIVWAGTMDVQEDHNRTVQTAFPLATILKPGQTGAFLVVAEDDAHAAPEKDWTTRQNDGDCCDDDSAFFRNKATHWVVATDIALTTYTGTDGMRVAARSLATALPLQGVRLSLLSTGQDLLGEATTDAAGMVRFAPGLLRGRNAAAAGSVVAHEAGGDWTLLDLNRPGFDFSDRGVTGRPSPAPLQAFVYTDRGIYRPGHTVELMALLRDRVGEAVAGTLTLVLRRPNGMEARRWTLPAAPAAGFHQAIPLSATAPRGSWSVEALADPQGDPVGRTTFEVQDYVPQQLKVKLAPVAAPGGPDGRVSVALSGDFLYGAPAAGLRGQADLRVTRDTSPVPGAKDWQFGPADETVDDKTKTLDLPVSDAHGQTQAEAAPDLPEGVRSPLKLIVTAGLFEPSGRQVSDSAEVKLRTQPLLIGLRAQAASTGLEQPNRLGIAVFDPGTGAMAARRGLVWHVVEEQRLFDWFSNDGAWHWHYRTQDRPVADGTIDTDGGPVTLTRQDGWGQYRLVVEDPKTGATSSIRYRQGWDETAGDTERPDKIAVSVDRPAIAQGGTARIHIAAPFAGRATLLIANDRILESRELAVPQGGLDVPVTATPDWGAGAYALVTLYRPLREDLANGSVEAGAGAPGREAGAGAPGREAGAGAPGREAGAGAPGREAGAGAPGRPSSAHAPVRAVGTVWIGMDAAPRTLSVAIGTPDRVLPRQDVAVPLRIGGVAAGAQAYVTLAAVDEGVLQLTRFATPDPAGFLFGKRALGLAMRDDYAKLLDGSAEAGQVQGGDEGIGGPGLPVVSTRTVAAFEGPVSVAPDGTASVTLHVPDFEGQLRLMAVAYTSHAAGSAQRTMIVRDPLVADVAMPRFLADGDSAALAVSLDNTDAPAGLYHLQVAASGAAALQGAAGFDDTLAPGARARHSVTLAGSKAGVAGITADLTGPGGLHVHRSWQLSVRPAHAPVTLQQTAWQKPGQSFRVDPGLLAPFVPGTTTLSVGYSRWGGLDVPGLLQSLDQYPFGCTEQLSSTAFPLLYFSDPALHAALPDAARVHARVQSAIDTILDRQGDDGMFGLWRENDGEASTWLDVYALDFLLHAKEAGFDVPDSAIQRAAQWLRAAAEGETRRSFEGAYAAGPELTRPYAAYVLARLGRIDLAGLRRLHDVMPREGAPPSRPVWLASGGAVIEPLALGQMAGAFALSGDTWRARDTFRRAVDNLGYHDWPGWWWDWSYFTPARDWAGLVAIAAETHQDDMLHLLLDRDVPERLDIEYLNTQEKAALLSAAHALAASGEAVSLAVNGQPAAAGSQPSFSPDPAALAAGYTIANTASRALWRALTVTGNPKAASPELAAGYTLKKAYYTLTGETLDPATMRQNDRVVVVLEGEVTDRLASHRTVLVDLLPAGWEIEAPVRDDTEFGFIGPLSATRVREARDDRFVAAMDFGDDLSRGLRSAEVDDTEPHLDDWSFRVAYVARAITPGHFTLPEAYVQDMYRPAVMARTGAGATDVVPR